MVGIFVVEEPDDAIGKKEVIYGVKTMRYSVFFMLFGILCEHRFGHGTGESRRWQRPNGLHLQIKYPRI